MTSSDSLKIFFPLLEKVSCKLKMTGSKKKKKRKHCTCIQMQIPLFDLNMSAHWSE